MVERQDARLSLSVFKQSKFLPCYCGPVKTKGNRVSFTSPMSENHLIISQHKQGTRIISHTGLIMSDAYE